MCKNTNVDATVRKMERGCFRKQQIEKRYQKTPMCDACRTCGKLFAYAERPQKCGFS